MTVVVWISGLLVLAGGLMAIVRAERGPSILDRTVALDILMTTLVAAVALYAALERRADVVPVLVALSAVGFVGSVTVARFASVEPPGEGRVMTRREAALDRAAQLAQESDDPDDSTDPEPEPSPAPAGSEGPATEPDPTPSGRRFLDGSSARTDDPSRNRRPRDTAGWEPEETS